MALTRQQLERWQGRSGHRRAVVAPPPVSDKGVLEPNRRRSLAFLFEQRAQGGLSSKRRGNLLLEPFA
jgi:hypothetical protein